MNDLPVIPYLEQIGFKSEAEKAGNPYHDARGKFTSGSGGGGASGLGGGGKSPKEMFHARGAELKKEAGKHKGWSVGKMGWRHESLRLGSLIRLSLVIF